MLKKITGDLDFNFSQGFEKSIINEEKSFNNLGTDEEIKDLIIKNLNIQLSLCTLYDNYLFYKKILSGQRPSSHIFVLEDMVEDKIETYSKIFESMIFSYLDGDLIHISYCDLGESLERVISIYEDLLENNLLNKDILSHFLNPNRREDFNLDQEITWYKYEEDLTGPWDFEPGEDFLDLFLKAKINRNRPIFIQSYKSLDQVEEEIREKSWARKVEEIYLREDFNGTLMALRGRRL